MGALQETNHLQALLLPASKVSRVKAAIYRVCRVSILVTMVLGRYHVLVHLHHGPSRLAPKPFVGSFLRDSM